MTHALILTPIDCCAYWYTYPTVTQPSSIFTCQGCCLYIQQLGYSCCTGSTSEGSWIYSKPAVYNSISGLYGGADNTDVSLSHYYKGGSYVTNTAGNASVPTSGTIDFSDFHGQNQ